MIKLHEDSHVDHAVPNPVLDYVLRQFEDRTTFFIETITYPEKGTWSSPRTEGRWVPWDFATTPCALHIDVPEDEVHYAKRGDREYESRMCKRSPRMVREITIIAGPHPDDSDVGMILYTMYGGPAAPKEPGDPRLTDEEREESVAFWSKAALGPEE